MCEKVIDITIDLIASLYITNYDRNTFKLVIHNLLLDEFQIQNNTFYVN
jgi:hypothetical protein